MKKEGVWLGSLRQPVRWLAVASTIIALLVFAWLALSHLFSSEPIGMYEVIRPAGRPSAMLMLGSLAAAIFFGSLYLSDNIGAIEPEPDGFFDVLSLVTSRMAMIGTLFVVIAMFYEVVARYVFNAPTLWANELSLWIAAMVFLFAGQYAMQQRSHIRIYVVYDMMPRWMQKASDVISVLLIVFFTFTLLWGGFDDAWVRFWRGETFGTAWDPPIPATIKPAILIIITLVTVQAISNLIADWNKAPEHHSPMDEIDQTEIENIRKSLKE